MPFKSLAQKGFLFANHPGVAKEFAAATSPSQMQALPKYAGASAALQDPTKLAKGGYAAPKWQTNPWGEMIKRRGVANLRNKGF